MWGTGYSSRSLAGGASPVQQYHHNISDCTQCCCCSPRAMQRKYAADQSRRSRGWVRMAALVYCFRMPGNSAVAGSGSGWSLLCPGYWLPEGIWMGWLPRATFCMSGMVLAVTPPRSLCDGVSGRWWRLYHCHHGHRGFPPTLCPAAPIIIIMIEYITT